MIAAKTEEDLKTILEKSHSQPVLLIKHSTRCSISMAAMREVESFEKAHPEIPVYLNLILDDRPFSNHVAQTTGIQHESPQAFVFKNGEVFWNASHGDIYLEALESEIYSPSSR